jgi:ligand-binding sensor domain-containing protein
MRRLVLVALAMRCFALDPGRPIVAYQYDIWQARKGLGYWTIHAIAQSRDGYLWLGTDRGLVRFNGIEFTLFSGANTGGSVEGTVWDLAQTVPIAKPIHRGIHHLKDPA